MMVTFVLEGDAASGNLTRTDMDSIPLVDETVEIKGNEYVVRSRRWKLGRLGPSVALTVRALFETTP